MTCLERCIADHRLAGRGKVYVFENNLWAARCVLHAELNDIADVAPTAAYQLNAIESVLYGRHTEIEYRSGGKGSSARQGASSERSSVFVDDWKGRRFHENLTDG